jgi:hypothetical protein
VNHRVGRLGDRSFGIPDRGGSGVPVDEDLLGFSEGDLPGAVIVLPGEAILEDCFGPGLPDGANRELE